MNEPAIFQISPGGRYRQGHAGETIFPMAMDASQVGAFLQFWDMEGVQFQLVVVKAAQPLPEAPGEEKGARTYKTPAQRLHANGWLNNPDFKSFLGLHSEAPESVAHEAVKARLHLSSLAELTDADFASLQSAFLKYKRGGVR
jgi:hypothetical protein